MDFAAMFQTWIDVLTKPGERIFEREQSKAEATLTTALLWIVIAAVVAALLGFVRGLLFASQVQGIQRLIQSDMPPQMANQFSQLMSSGLFAGMMGGGSLLSIIITPLFFVIGVGILHFVATLLGGRGDFGQYAYLNATFQAPLSIVSALLAFVPVLGGCLSPLVTVYTIVLAYFATKVNYNLTSGKAIVVVLIPLIFLLLLVGCFVLGIAGLIFSVGNG